MVDWIWPSFLVPTMIATDVLPAPVLHGISLPEPQMWASDHSGSIRGQPFQIHSGDKDSSLGLKCMPGMWAARVWEDQRRMKNTGGSEWDAENPTNSAAPGPLGHGTTPSLPIPLRPYAPCPSVTHSFYICSRALQRLQYRVIHKSISSLTKAIIRKDRESEGHRQKSANKPGWSMKRGGTTGMETRKLWASVWIKVLFTLGKCWEELGV